MSKTHMYMLDDDGRWSPARSSSATGGAGGGGSQATQDDWTYAGPSGGIVDTSDDTLVAAGGTQTVNYLSAIQMRNADASIATEVVVKSGSDVLWRMDLDSNSDMLSVVFPKPLAAAQNTALTVACLTTSSETYINAQGYTAKDVAVVGDFATVGEEIYGHDGNLLTTGGETLYTGAIY